MVKTEELLSHAVRCQALADTCSDPTVAEKFRWLAKEYRDLAAHPPPGSKIIDPMTYPLRDAQQK